ncbi:ribosome maturation factor RimM [Buchnera aphidicola]|uniref:ribosome maturation factor RimM n=1 Tax=Buchnera aphidicola TaxID=9 RepID=UPI003463AF66
MGKIGKAYGILGWLNIFSFTEKQENIFNYFPWFFIKEKKWEIIQPKNWQKHKNHFVVHIKNIDNRSVAMQFTNANIFINECQLPQLKKNEYYWQDIMNYQVFNTKNTYLGHVINIIRTTHNDIFVIKKKSELFNEKQVLIPVIYEKIIKKIDTIKKIINVQWD